ncbi:hypothetical protein E4T44_02039 [Aureobasidium sp. EXF-8845]|nr:hypothetical protein E4T44_02039 [Aureobasidium sp. EXF-8845]KAI4856486.1 hypothetical protein E4T45_02051 [Aureobasidium sp. EXF-8846]
MPDKRTAESKRPYKPRTRTGCVTCRRIKCDEARPSCLKCTSTGRKCDGYIMPAASSPCLPREMSLNVYKPGEESSAIDFFLRVSIPQFAGNSQSEFWNRHVLQLAQQDAATKHALVALAHLHRDFTNPGSHGQHNQSALHHYDTAIRNHIKSLSGEMNETANSGTAMTTAIVFICIEIMQGHLASAVSLLQHSVAMLSKSGNQQVSLYGDIISRLQIHARRSVDKNMFGSDPCDHTSKEVISKYKAPQDWHNSCRDLLKNCTTMFDQVPLEEKIQRLCIILAAPKATHYHQPLSRETAAYNVLYMRKLLQITDLLIEEASHVHEEQRATIYDSFLPIYSNIVSLAESNLGLTNPAAQERPLTPSFALDMGVIGPLYEVSRHCRDPTLRRKIVHLLHISNRQEGLLISRTYAKIVQTIINVEESGLEEVKVSGDIPLSSRISHHCLSFDMKRLRHTLSFKQVVRDEEKFCHREIPM